jgi:hypothetical protein
MSENFDSAIPSRAAESFLGSLNTDQSEQAQFEFDDPIRLDWTYVPRSRQGLPLKGMSAEQREAAFALLDSSVSATGSEKARAIMKLEGILGKTEGNENFRDPEKYHIFIFGKPKIKRTWAWRIEGHHLSLNFTYGAGGGVSVTPAFWGANPAEVRKGSDSGTRVLAAEEDMGRQLMRALDEDQIEKALISREAYPEILTGTDAQPRIPTRMGLPLANMTSQQKDVVVAIIRLHAENLSDDLRDRAIARIGDPVAADILFAWAGGTEPGQGHYYRIHGTSFIIEYDNTQNGANHIHTVWRDETDDFGADHLIRHHAESHR